jgi:flagellar basal-body rod modification protein FlgD
MTVNGISSLAASDFASATAAAQATVVSQAAERANDLDQNAFLRLLVTQLRFQNPLDLSSGAEFVSQLATFSTLQGIDNLNRSFADMLRLQQLTQGIQLIGREVTFIASGESDPQSGVVDSISIDDNRLNLHVGSQIVSLSEVIGIGT